LYFWTMTHLDLTTPALLFPAISLLLLAYTNRFLAVAQLTRQLHAQWQKGADPALKDQIASLTRRVRMIRYMQALGIASFLACSITMLCIYLNLVHLAEWVFGAAMTLLVWSLWVSLQEVLVSTQALDRQLRDMSR
jgi:hypothetical protein